MKEANRPRPATLADFLSASDSPSERLLCSVVQPGVDRWMTTSELRTQVARFAQLAPLGTLPAGARIAIAAENCPEYLSLCLAAFNRGLSAVPINHRLPDAVIDSVLSEVECACLLTDSVANREVDMLQWKIGELARRAMSRPGADASDSVSLAPAPAGSEEAIVLFTSGSTGLPKGVPLTHSGLLWAIGRYDWLRPLVQGKTIVVAAPLFHMNALFSSLLLMHLGARLALLPRFEVNEYVHAVSRHRSPVLTLIPTMLALIARESGLLADCDLSCVRVVLTGSAPLTEKVLAMARETFPCARILNTWGTTEAGPACFGPHPLGLPRPDLSIGYPIEDVSVRLVGGASPDEGVLHLRTPAMMNGYLNRPLETARRLRYGWYDTGDVMRRDADGFYYFVGRSDDMFVCSGENLYPAEIEERIELHPDVAQAAVVPVPDDVRGAIPIAFVVLRPEAALNEDAIKRFALDHGPAFAHPRRVFLLPELPLAGSNKVDRSRLTAIARAACAGQS